MNDLYLSRRQTNRQNLNKMTKIEWTNETWNPIIGCSKVSEGCLNCYAEKFAYRLSQNPITTKHYSNVLDLVTGWKVFRWNGKTALIESALEKPFHWKKPRMIFVCSMGDLFHESVPCEWINKVFNIIDQCPQHIFQILTKRPKRIIEFIKKVDMWWDMKNVWWGITCENQKTADERISVLLEIPTKVRFVSCEPLLSEIDITEYLGKVPPGVHNGKYLEWIDGVNWIIAGKETGHGARPMKIEWLKSLYEQCKSAGVPFFDKRNELGLNIQEYPKL